MIHSAGREPVKVQSDSSILVKGNLGPGSELESKGDILVLGRYGWNVHLINLLISW